MYREAMSSGLGDPNDPPVCLKWSGRQLCSGTLLRQSGWKVIAEVADGALAQLGSPRSTLFRAVARLCRTRRASSLLPLKCGTRDRSSILDPRIEGVVEEQIERFWLKKEKSRFSGLVERVHDPCHVEGLRAPHRKTIAARHGIKPDGAARRRGQGVWRRRLPFFTPSMTTAWLSERGIHTVVAAPPRCARLPRNPKCQQAAAA